MTKILYLKEVFAKNAIFSNIMSQSKELFWLIYPSTYLAMEELQVKLLENSSRQSFYFGAKRSFSPKNGGTMKYVIALNLYIGTNVLVYERRLMVKVWSMTKFLC